MALDLVAGIMSRERTGDKVTFALAAMFDGAATSFDFEQFPAERIAPRPTSAHFPILNTVDGLAGRDF
ncbi:MAG: hypothetical protein EA378_10560 [Phycisphaerales bacterium]|nr:MAG: hypothetical protein EA378_10560 [Phycisphaerales bacterium]